MRYHAGSWLEGGVDDSNFSKCYKIKNLTDEEATLLEPASCAIHGMDKLKLPFGAKVLLIGAGPTGLILAQLIKVRPRTVVAAQMLMPDGRSVTHHHRRQQGYQDGHCAKGRSGRCVH